MQKSRGVRYQKKVLYQKGFTLLEMSILLIIIGILAAGIVIGQGIIHQSEMRKTVSEVGQFRTSINAFVTQYDALPGDFSDAESFWGDSNTPGGTQNGNGDKIVQFVVNSDVYEGYRAWQHLGKALLVPGIFPGTATVGTPVLGIDLPRAEIRGGYAIESDALGMIGQLVVLLGDPLASTETMRMAGDIRPEDGLDIDLKVDDGIPTKGVVRGADGVTSASGDCIDTGVNPPEYDLTKSAKECILGFQF